MPALPFPACRILAGAVLCLAFGGLAHAQYYGQQPYGQPPPQGGDQTILYNTQKHAPPAAVVIEHGPGAPGIPTSGVQQQQQLTPKGARGGPTVIRRDKGLTVITGPDGTTVCRDVSGRTVVCY
ncbi:MAG: hypothetical protein OSW77_06350 [Proteobacteria bacterium]|jgi:hypothetical protein|nr:hypothetical protein [Pseudomonadota bacterium]